MEEDNFNSLAALQKEILDNVVGDVKKDGELIFSTWTLNRKENEENMLHNSCTRFRENVSLNLYFMKYWQLASNKFYPENSIKQKQVVQLATSALSVLENKLFDTNIKSLCLNDSSLCDYDDYMQAKPLVVKLFEKKHPRKSSFEL